MATTTQTVTIEELCTYPPDGRWEIVEGRLVTMTPTGYEHAGIVATITALLHQHVTSQRLGRVVTGETGFILSRDPDTLRAPDVAFVSAERDDPDERGFFPGAPDLAVEVVSPQDRQQDVEAKARAWLEAGAHHGLDRLARDAVGDDPQNRPTGAHPPRRRHAHRRSAVARLRMQYRRHLREVK
jgi:Uma2 family endonuclease